jgi:hypothetical protein
MSTYQYYEFRAMDRPLTREQREEIASLSSRATVTSHQAIFAYLYEDFRGDEEKLMETHFDMMLCVANWGTRRVMFRLPSSLIDMNQLDSFCISEEIGHWLTKDKQYTILDLNFENEDMYGDGIEGEGLLNELIDLREELIQGDFRLLYLAWLKAAKALEMEDIDEEILEPPVPSGLKQLSNAQEAYIKFLDIDRGMVAVASEQSEEQQNELIDVEEWIEILTEEKRYEFLLRLSRGEQNLSTIFNRYLHEFATKGQSQKTEEKTERRTISSLIKDAEAWHKQENKKREEEYELARKQRLELLAKNKSMVWEKVYKLIDEMNANAYDRAVKQLKELRELSQYQGEEGLFEQQIAKIQSTYSRRQALLRRMRSVGLI